MSAYIVDKITIDRVVSAYSIIGNIQDDLNKIGQMLWDENVKSVNCRYLENNAVIQYQFQYRKETPVQYLKSAYCLDYQSCEYEDYENSKAYEIINAVQQYFKEEKTQNPKGYEEAEWG